MRNYWLKEVLAKADAFEVPLCLAFNRVSKRKLLGPFFALVSRLGNGIFWYALMAALPPIYGSAGWAAVGHMAMVGLIGLGFYRTVKDRTSRRRPYIAHGAIWKTVPPLDRYSFPSGHTLHAVSFSTVAAIHFPELAWLTVPFAILVGLSRVVLGLHYPSDVLAGAFSGFILAQSVGFFRF